MASVASTVEASHPLRSREAPVKAPVALVLFNRPDTTRPVFEAIRAARPPKLLLIADGPRPDRPEDAEGCAAARAVVENVDWDCEVLRNYADENLGCGKRPASGIDWVFENVDRAILMEDDCVPHPSFFRYCDELLERYADDERIAQISGHNFQFGNRRGPYSYFFSRHNICLGGFATWRRAWNHFDFEVRGWPELRDIGWLADFLVDQRGVDHWTPLFDRAHAAAGEADYWDYQWTFACWAQHGISILPNPTLLSNIGFGDHATHTKSSDHKLANLNLEEMTFPMTHPPHVVPHAEADRFFIDAVVAPERQAPLLTRLRWKVSEALPAPVRDTVKRLLGR
ncbi:MAG: glycosyltransferase family 2 protein [bacterium]|nr:glycosyltransferase family 2 protein [bacterium]